MSPKTLLSLVCPHRFRQSNCNISVREGFPSAKGGNPYFHQQGGNSGSTTGGIWRKRVLQPLLPPPKEERGGGGGLKNAYVTCHALCNASSELAHISWFTLCISFSIKLLCNDLCREIHYTNKPELN